MRDSQKGETKLLLALLALAMSGCFIGANDCGFAPIGASIRAPIAVPNQPDQVGACGNWVKIDGALWTQSRYDFALDAETLEPIGEATEAALGVTALAAPTIYAIPGTDPEEAVAMERPDGSFVVFTYSGDGPFPSALCALLAPTGNSDPSNC